MLGREVHIAIQLNVVEKDLIPELNVVALLSDLILWEDLEYHAGGEAF